MIPKSTPLNKEHRVNIDGEVFHYNYFLKVENLKEHLEVVVNFDMLKTH